MNNNCEQRIYADSSWFWFLAPLNVDTGQLLTSGTKPVVTVQIGGAAPAPLDSSKVVWGSFDSDGYTIASGTLVYSLRIEVPPAPVGTVTVQATFAAPPHVVTIKKDIY